MYWQRNMFRIFSSEESELENITYRRTHLCDPLRLCVSQYFVHCSLFLSTSRHSDSW